MTPFFLLSVFSTHAVEFYDSEVKHIGELIFQNECASQVSCLTSWNKGEDFASLGIGHFIWYPKGVVESGKRFDESFPKLLIWMQQQGVELPAWLMMQKGAPWKNRAAFEKDQNTKKMRLFRQFLLKTRHFQVKFMKNRFQKAIQNILQHTPQGRQAHIQQQFQYVTESPMGFYALMDYVNFKGEGIKLSERYQGQGWGLLQVLDHMQSTAAGVDTIEDFSQSADFVLTRRVLLSPPSRHEKRWLTGWKKRIWTYVQEAK